MIIQIISIIFVLYITYYVILYFNSMKGYISLEETKNEHINKQIDDIQIDISNNISIDTSNIICEDYYNKCGHLAISGECNTHPDYMNKNCCISCKIKKNYNLSDKLLVFNETEYYILAGNDIKYKNDSDIISKIIFECIDNLNDTTSKKNLQNNKFIFLVGDSGKDFTEFLHFHDVKTSEGSRNLIDISAWGPLQPSPGFIKNTYSTCINQIDENIIVHEALHAIHLYGFDSNKQNRIIELYKKYNNPNNNYNTSGVYGFVTEFEFFSIMTSVYLGMNVRMDVTGNINKDILKQHLPDMYSFLKELYPDPEVFKEKVCSILKCNFC